MALLFALVHPGFPGAGKETPALPSDAAAAQADYLVQRRKGLLQLNDRYLAKLNEILVVHTRSGRLEQALAVRTEVARIEEENTSLKIEGPPRRHRPREGSRKARPRLRRGRRGTGKRPRRSRHRRRC